MRRSVPSKFTEAFIKKLRASSIVEIIVALAICMIIFLIAMNVIVNSQQSNNIRLKQKAQFILSHMNANVMYPDSSMEIESLSIETIVQNIDTIPGVRRVNCLIKDNTGHLLAMKVMWLSTNHPDSVKIENR